VRALAHFARRVDDGGGQTRDRHGAQVGPVVADEGAVGERDAMARTQRLQRLRLVRHRLQYVVDAQFGRACLDDRRSPRGDERDAHAGLAQQRRSEAVAHGERLHRLAVASDVQPRIGERAVDVERDQPHPRRALDDLVGLRPFTLHPSPFTV